jgi:hypothetical protein
MLRISQIQCGAARRVDEDAAQLCQAGDSAPDLA